MNSPIFPGMIAPIILSEEKFTQELDNHLMKAGFVALNLVKSDYSENENGEESFGDENIEEDDLAFDEREISSNDIYKVGVICKVVKKLKTT